jgi:protein-S-isoprenylcysteine O-methyltransferase Ste14
VLNSQSYTQAAWWNRIPFAAWALMITISIFCNLMIGFSTRGKGLLLYLILPIALAISLFLIADIDSPRSGIIQVQPQNLESLAASLNSAAPQK